MSVAATTTTSSSEIVKSQVLSRADQRRVRQNNDKQKNIKFNDKVNTAVQTILDNPVPDADCERLLYKLMDDTHAVTLSQHPIDQHLNQAKIISGRISTVLKNLTDLINSPSTSNWKEQVVEMNSDLSTALKLFEENTSTKNDPRIPTATEQYEGGLPLTLWPNKVRSSIELGKISEQCMLIKVNSEQLQTVLKKEIKVVELQKELEKPETRIECVKEILSSEKKIVIISKQLASIKSSLDVLLAPGAVTESAPSSPTQDEEDIKFLQSVSLPKFFSESYELMAIQKKICEEVETIREAARTVKLKCDERCRKLDVHCQKREKRKTKTTSLYADLNTNYTQLRDSMIALHKDVVSKYETLNRLKVLYERSAIYNPADLYKMAVITAIPVNLVSKISKENSQHLITHLVEMQANFKKLDKETSDKFSNATWELTLITLAVANNGLKVNETLARSTTFTNINPSPYEHTLKVLV